MRNEIIISKMIEYADKISSYVAGMNYNEFSKNSLVVEACVFDLSQMGELANRLDDSFVKQYKNIPWKQVYGLRNRIVHDYEGVNLILVWEIICDDIPELREKLLSLQ